VLHVLATILAQAEEHVEEAPPNPILPEPVELIVGGIVFLIVFAVIAKLAFPALNKMLDQRTAKIQGDMEKAEDARRTAEQELANYRDQLAGARDEANRIIEEARRTADQMRRDLQVKAEEESQAIVARAQDEIRAERDRVFQELRAQVGQIAVELAGRVVGESLDEQAHQRLIDDYIDQVSSTNGRN
jgi:F-type H+-transporting ATPase subunit b